MHLIIQLVSLSLKGVKFLARFYLTGIGVLLAFATAVFYLLYQFADIIVNSSIPSFDFLEPIRQGVQSVAETIQLNETATLFFYSIAGDVAIQGIINSLLFMANCFLGAFLVTAFNLILISVPALGAKIKSYVAEKQFKT